MLVTKIILLTKIFFVTKILCRHIETIVIYHFEAKIRAVISIR